MKKKRIIGAILFLSLSVWTVATVCYVRSQPPSHRKIKTLITETEDVAKLEKIEATLDSIEIKDIGDKTENGWPVKVQITVTIKPSDTEEITVKNLEEYYIGKDDYGDWQASR